MDLGLNGRIALVAGGSGGIGRAIALELAREGARVAICARGEEPLRDAAAYIGAEAPGTEVLALRAELNRPDEVAGMAAELRERLGPPAIVVNAAGHGSPGTMETVGPAELQDMLDTNLLPCLLLARAFAPAMAEARWGRIIFVAAVSGRQPTLGQLGSNVAKAGVINLAKELSGELAEAGVTVNTVLPGRVATPRVMRVFSDDERRRRSSAIPMRRYGTPEEFAAAVAFLASERAGYITGVALAIDGGLVASMF
ncbi:MAG TPA: SDR family oxidoreductase [Chloroflexota bacterium]|nr:SDR family oxidoreductase [Chloroflexota bacterium]